MKMITLLIEDEGVEPPTVAIGDCDPRVVMWALNAAYLAIEEQLPGFVVETTTPMESW